MSLQDFLSSTQYELVLRRSENGPAFPMHLALIAWQLGLVNLQELTTILDTQINHPPL